MILIIIHTLSYQEGIENMLSKNPYNGTDHYSNNRFKLQTENVHDRKNIVEYLQKLSA